MIRFCRRCGASLGPSARFCGACGAATRDYRLQHRIALRDAARQDRRRALVLGVVFVGVIAGLVLPHLLVPEGEVSSTVTLAFDLLLGAAVVAWLGRGAWRTAIGRWPGPTAFLLALPVAAVSLLVAVLWVEVLRAVSGGGHAEDADDGAMWLAVLVYAPLAEEWLCRGALWAAIRPVTSRFTAIVCTAVLFAFMHGLNGGFVLELPHRFAGGVAFGWLRARTGSLWPCVVAHAAHNAAAVALG